MQAKEQKEKLRSRKANEKVLRSEAEAKRELSQILFYTLRCVASATKMTGTLCKVCAGIEGTVQNSSGTRQAGSNHSDSHSMSVCLWPTIYGKLENTIEQAIGASNKGL